MDYSISGHFFENNFTRRLANFPTNGAFWSDTMDSITLSYLLFNPDKKLEHSLYLEKDRKIPADKIIENELKEYLVSKYFPLEDHFTRKHITLLRFKTACFFALNKLSNQLNSMYQTSYKITDTGKLSYLESVKSMVHFNYENLVDGIESKLGIPFSGFVGVEGKRPSNAQIIWIEECEKLAPLSYFIDAILNRTIFRYDVSYTNYDFSNLRRFYDTSSTIHWNEQKLYHANPKTTTTTRTQSSVVTSTTSSTTTTTTDTTTNTKTIGIQSSATNTFDDISKLVKGIFGIDKIPIFSDLTKNNLPTMTKALTYHRPICDYYKVETVGNVKRIVPRIVSCYDNEVYFFRMLTYIGIILSKSSKLLKENFNEQSDSEDSFFLPPYVKLPFKRGKKEDSRNFEDLGNSHRHYIEKVKKTITAFDESEFSEENFFNYVYFASEADVKNYTRVYRTSSPILIKSTGKNTEIIVTTKDQNLEGIEKMEISTPTTANDIGSDLKPEATSDSTNNLESTKRSATTLLSIKYSDSLHSFSNLVITHFYLQHITIYDLYPMVKKLFSNTKSYAIDAKGALYQSALVEEQDLERIGVSKSKESSIFSWLSDKAIDMFTRCFKYSISKQLQEYGIHVEIISSFTFAFLDTQNNNAINYLCSRLGVDQNIVDRNTIYRTSLNYNSLTSDTTDKIKSELTTNFRSIIKFAWDKIPTDSGYTFVFNHKSGNHFVLYVVDHQRKVVVFFDSQYKRLNHTYDRSIKFIFNKIILMQIIAKVKNTIGDGLLDVVTVGTQIPEEWKKIVKDSVLFYSSYILDNDANNSPIQDNDLDCGVFASINCAMFMKKLILPGDDNRVETIKLWYSRNQIPYYRFYMALFICKYIYEDDDLFMKELHELFSKDPQKLKEFNKILDDLKKTYADRKPKIIPEGSKGRVWLRDKPYTGPVYSTTQKKRYPDTHGDAPQTKKTRLNTSSSARKRFGPHLEVDIPENLITLKFGPESVLKKRRMVHPKKLTYLVRIISGCQFLSNLINFLTPSIPGLQMNL